MRSWGMVPLLVVLLSACAAAQEGKIVRVTVTSISGRSLYLDEGTGAGIEPGLRVRLSPPGAPPVEGVVVVASTNSARVDLAPGLPLPPVGTQGEVRVAKAAASGEGTAGAGGAAQGPAHPPWSRESQERSPGLPLLAPAFGQRPEARPVELTGRVFTQLDYNRDEGSTRNNKYFLGRLGTRLEAVNLLGQGGLLRFAGEVNRRGADLLDEGDSAETRARIDWASYAIGGEDFRAYRVELGRFQSLHVPELGLLDGVEGAVQFEGGLSAGVGFGGYPIPFPYRTPVKDISFHVFANYQSESSDALSAAIAYQKTWHEGASDRDMLMGRLNVRPTDTLWLYGLVKVDFYTGSDTIKDSSVQLTEAWAQARWTPDPRRGAALSYSLYRWPELKREEYIGLDPRFVADGQVDRLDLSGWHDLGESLRATGRINYWRDQDRDGFGGEVIVDWDDVFDSGMLLAGGLFYADGAFNRGPGFRVDARRGFGSFFGFVGYDWNSYSTRDLFGADETFVRQNLRAGVDANFGHWSLNLGAFRNFGDGEDAHGVNLYVQYYF